MFWKADRRHPQSGGDERRVFFCFDKLDEMWMTQVTRIGQIDRAGFLSELPSADSVSVLQTLNKTSAHHFIIWCPFYVTCDPLHVWWLSSQLPVGSLHSVLALNVSSASFDKRGRSNSRIHFTCLLRWTLHSSSPPKKTSSDLNGSFPLSLWVSINDRPGGKHWLDWFKLSGKSLKTFS